MEDQQIAVDGVRLQVRDDGGTKEAVLFLHYGGGNLEMWEPVVPHFGASYRCVRVDLRGHGRSDAPPTGYSLAQLASDVEGVLDALRIDRAHIVGSSLGAEAGLAFAATCPERVSTLVCDGAFHDEYGPYGLRDATDFQTDEELRRQLATDCAQPEPTYPSVAAFVRHVRDARAASGTWNEAMEAVTRRNALELDDGRVVHAWRKWARDEYMSHYFAARFEDYYTALECPVLFLPGEREAADPMICDALTAFSRLVDRCEIVQVPGAVHPFGWVFVSAAMSHAVLDFLADHLF